MVAAISTSVAITVLVVVVAMATALPVGIAVIVCRNRKKKHAAQDPDEENGIQCPDQSFSDPQPPSNTEANTR